MDYESSHRIWNLGYRNPNPCHRRLDPDQGTGPAPPNSETLTLGQARPGPGPGQARPGQARPGQASLAQPSQAKPSSIQPSHALGLRFKGIEMQAGIVAYFFKNLISYQENRQKLATKHVIINICQDTIRCRFG